MINSVVLVGNVGQDPEMKYFESGKVKTTLSMAVNKRVKDKDQTSWFKVEFWNRTAEIAGEYVRKGNLIGVEGRLEFNHWTDKEGEKVVTPFIAGDNLRLFGKREG